ncbi:alpha/beta fold hydrolase [Sphingomonas sp. MMS24-JH45]
MLSGLTRNARDFSALAERLSPRRRVLAVEFRGRGESGYAKDPMSYVPLTYAQDVAALLEEQRDDRFVAVSACARRDRHHVARGARPGGSWALC